MTNTDKITREEMIELFGDDCPVEAIQVMFEAKPTDTVGDVRARLRAIAAAKAMPAPTDPFNALTAAQRWMIAHAQHVGTCIGGRSTCTCGLAAILRQVATALLTNGKYSEERYED